MLIKEIFGGHPLAADIHCVDSNGDKATPSFPHPIGLYRWLKENGFHEVPRSDARHDHVLGMYERNVPAFSDEHVIGYAYPTSESAGKLGCGKSGCFYLQAKGRITAHKTINQALRAALELGTKPGLWSMDHPNHQMQSTTASKEACL